MSNPVALSPAVLQILQPLRGQLGTRWEAVLTGVALAPDPALAAASFSRLLEGGLGSGAVLESATLCNDLLFVLGSSQLLSGVLSRQGEGWEAVFLADRTAALTTVAAHLSALHESLSFALSEDEFMRELRIYRNREYFRIGLRDLLGLASLSETTAELSFLAEAVVQIAYEYTRARVRVAYGEAVVQEQDGVRPLGFVVFGMGKLGGVELNFSSDIDLIFLYERDAGLTTGGEKGAVEPRIFFSQLAQGLTRVVSELVAGGRVFRVDLRLRPDGVNGPIVNPLSNALLYYESWGQTWERVALLKARPIAGEKDLGEQFLRDIAPFVFRRYLDFSTIEDIKGMKARVERSLRAPERGGMNVKLGRGGIREIEFIVQALQLIHAGKDGRVRERTTLPALERLVECRYLAAADRDTLRDAYRFLRHVEHKLQIVQDRQTHTLPEDEAGIRALARRLRISEQQGQVGSGKWKVESDRGPDEAGMFWAVLRAHMDAVHQIFSTLFHDQDGAVAPPLGEFSELFRELHQEERVIWRLQKLGFQELPEAYGNLRLLHDGPSHSPATPKRRKLLYDLAPMLLQEVAKAADPDRALAAMAHLVASIGARSSFLALLRENPQTLHTLIGLFGASAYLTQVFLRHPELLDSLVRADLVQVSKDKETMLAELTARLAEAREFEDRLDMLRRYRTEEFLRIGINDSNGLLDVTDVTAQLTSLAEVCLAGAYEVARVALMEQLGLACVPGQLAIVGMGKLGAGELNYNSDLDLIFLYAAEEEEAASRTSGTLSPQEFFTKLVQRLISVLQVQTREGYVYKIDTRLRPSGRSGSLVSSVAAFLRYHETSSQLWERQALIKARVVVGEPEFRTVVETALAGIAYAAGIDAVGVAEIDRLRGRMEQELAHEQAGRFNIKTGRGGIVDIEFLVQMLQLRYGQRLPTLRQRATLPALQALHEAGVLSQDDYLTLTQGYRFLRTVENRLRIEQDRPVEALESDAASLTPVARRLGYEGEAAARQLLTEYQSQREAIRACYSRWFAREKGQET
ncbi:MAG: bifunctional [glutamate--ammonia ligase]-adenylyl-L-tyrosine phosphorylase/[glutamate--ammonia-ligase] adenylyltransferase [Deltaproteobacteria bacterium]|nr:bifunctional [glutamate--ammonia ligase]-adenylyl-L-tyrosine phosphorylase/[glutamate--ammonia-ligase] adenylyltransferase [Deltaproteobacteria bacterium]